ncbi:MAG: TRZ/ATZ family hydrolase [Gammaproteobacteria bacterium]|nr:TRZ/ATZ family hydrolase [Gammaproteobacteria bacterium]
MEKVDLVIQARWIVPVEPRGVVLEDHALAVRDGEIVAILPAADVPEACPGAEVLMRPNHLLIPGLINAHTHAAMTLFRGMADDMSLEKWLGEHIWPAENRWVSPDFVRDGTHLAIIEMIRSGVTCFQDMYFFPDVVAQAAVEHKIRAVTGMIVLEAPTAWAANPDEYLEKGIEVHDRYLGHQHIHTSFAPHAPYTVSDETFGRLRVIADELDVPVHMHLHETATEVAEAEKTNGKRPIARIDELGLLNALLTAVHMTQLTDDEIKLLADRGVSVIHCPESNLKLASGFCPVAKLINSGINVALGTDGAASNNDLDMMGEMRTAALLGKGVSGDAASVSAEDVLAMATINGARAIGLGEITGSLEIGKRADMTCIDFSQPATQPVHHPISTLVYSATRDQVSDVWVEGNALLLDRALVNDPQKEILERASAWQRRLKEHDE